MDQIVEQITFKESMDNCILTEITIALKKDYGCSTFDDHCVVYISI